VAPSFAKGILHQKTSCLLTVDVNLVGYCCPVIRYLSSPTQEKKRLLAIHLSNRILAREKVKLISRGGFVARTQEGTSSLFDSFSLIRLCPTTFPGNESVPATFAVHVSVVFRLPLARMSCHLGKTRTREKENPQHNNKMDFSDSLLFGLRERKGNEKKKKKKDFLRTTKWLCCSSCLALTVLFRSGGRGWKKEGGRAMEWVEHVTGYQNSYSLRCWYPQSIYFYFIFIFFFILKKKWENKEERGFISRGILSRRSLDREVGTEYRESTSSIPPLSCWTLPA